MKVVTKDNFVSQNTPLNEIGKKAYSVLELEALAKQLGYSTPNFAIIPANAINIDWQALSKKVSYDNDYFNPFDLSPHNKHVLQSIFFSNFELFQQAFDVHSRDKKFPVLRTSLTIAPESNLSFAGINCTAYPSDVVDCIDFMAASIGEGYAGLFKPYTNWYLDRHQINDKTRRSAIGFFEFLNTDMQGTLVSESGNFFISHVDEDNTKSIITSEQLDQNDIIDPLKDLYKKCRLLTNKMGKSFEIEYRLSNNGDMYLTQARSISNKKVSGMPINTFDYFDFSKTKKDESKELIINAIKNQKVKNFIVNHRDKENKDAFYLLALAQYDLGVKDLSLNVLQNQGEEFDHFVTALNEDTFLQKISYQLK